MGNFDSEYTRDKYERWEWDNTKILYANDESRTRVLYIGDSISRGTRDVATPRCEEKILSDGIHYTQEGYGIFTDEIIKRLKEIIPNII